MLEKPAHQQGEHNRSIMARQTGIDRHNLHCLPEQHLSTAHHMHMCDETGSQQPGAKTHTLCGLLGRSIPISNSALFLSIHEWKTTTCRRPIPMELARADPGTRGLPNLKERPKKIMMRPPQGLRNLAANPTEE